MIDVDASPQDGNLSREGYLPGLYGAILAYPRDALNLQERMLSRLRSHFATVEKVTLTDAAGRYHTHPRLRAFCTYGNNDLQRGALKNCIITPVTR